MTSSIRFFIRLTPTLRCLNKSVNAELITKKVPQHSPAFHRFRLMSSNDSENSNDSSSSSDSASDSSSDSSDDEKLQLARPGKQAAVQRQQILSDARMKLQAAEEGIDPELRRAAIEAAQSLSGDTTRVASDLLQRLKRPAPAESAENGSAPDLEQLFSGMRIEDGPKLMKERPMRSARGRKQAAERMAAGGQMEERNWKRQAPSRSAPDIQLFSGPDLGIFSAVNQPTPEDSLLEKPPKNLWEQLEMEKIQREMKRLPSNAFEEMIEWTEQGKLWKFPIDNEFDVGAEAEVGFHEHVFIDVGLKDIPEEFAPIRRFMQLVQLGLSRNPHLTLAEKKEHIDWYKQYFSDKLELAKSQEQLTA